MTVEELYEAYEADLDSYAQRLTRDPHRAGDLVQETFIRTMGHLDLLGQLEPYQQRSWLFRTLRNLFLDERLAANRYEALMTRLAYELPTVSHLEDTLMLSDLLDLVPEPHRQVVEMRYVQGMTSQEIGAELGIPAATVRSRLHLAIRGLRRQQSQLGLE